MSGIHLLRLGLAGPPGVINGSIPDTSGVGSCLVQFGNDGVYTYDGASTVNWITPATAVIAAQYQIKATLGAGTVSGTFGSWLDLSSNRSWTSNTLGPSVVTFEIREKVTGLLRTTQAVTFTVS